MMKSRPRSSRAPYITVKTILLILATLILLAQGCTTSSEPTIEMLDWKTDNLGLHQTIGITFRNIGDETYEWMEVVLDFKDADGNVLTRELESVYSELEFSPGETATVKYFFDNSLSWVQKSKDVTLHFRDKTYDPEKENWIRWRNAGE